MQEIKYFFPRTESPVRWFAFLVFVAALTIALNYSLAGTQLMFFVWVGILASIFLAVVFAMSFIYEGVEYTIDNERIKWVWKMKIAPVAWIFNTVGAAFGSVGPKGTSFMLKWITGLEYIPRINSAKVIFMTNIVPNSKSYIFVPFPPGRGEELFAELRERVEKAGGKV